MLRLLIQCRYIAHSYSGVRQNRDGRDELDWPPAPARLHQALIAATLANLPDALLSAYSDRTLDALRWLETLPPPDIIASALAADRDYRRALQVAMPHNSPAKGDFARYHPDLAPVFRASPKHDGSLFVAYRWADDSPEFCRKAELHLPALREAAAKLRYLGRAEDRIECEVDWHTDSNSWVSAETLEIWRPSANTTDLELWTARPNSTTELIQEFAQADKRIHRGSKRPARLFLRQRAYARDAAEALLPIHVAVFQIFNVDNPDQAPIACDAVNAHRWCSFLREVACGFAREVHRWNDPALAGELISGHTPAGGRTHQPHLAFIPLPSLSLRGKADGRVRRFALMGYSDADKVPLAASIYRTLAACLDGEEIELGYHLQLIERVNRDRVWQVYAGSSKVWLSATPVAIDRGYKVPTHSPDGQPLSSNERHLRRQAEWTDLVRASLRHIRLPDDLVAGCEITLTPSPLLAGTERAERYRRRNERIPFVHVRLEFSRPVRGPLLLGDRRYFGYGLFAPVAVE